MRYLDSNVFIYAVLADESTEPKARLAKHVLTNIAEGRLPAATSSLTWDEVTWNVQKRYGNKVAVEEGARFIEFPSLRILGVDEKILRRAEVVMAATGLDPRDSIHVACCIENGITELISNDGDMDQAKSVGVKRLSLEEA